jgi:hypothetical protein
MVLPWWQSVLWPVGAVNIEWWVTLPPRGK